MCSKKIDSEQQKIKMNNNCNGNGNGNEIFDSRNNGTTMHVGTTQSLSSNEPRQNKSTDAYAERDYYYLCEDFDKKKKHKHCSNNSNSRSSKRQKLPAFNTHKDSHKSNNQERAVYQVDIQTALVLTTFASCAEAAKAMGVPTTEIEKCANDVLAFNFHDCTNNVCNVCNGCNGCNENNSNDDNENLHCRHHRHRQQQQPQQCQGFWWQFAVKHVHPTIIKLLPTTTKQKARNNNHESDYSINNDDSINNQCETSNHLETDISKISPKTKSSHQRPVRQINDSTNEVIATYPSGKAAAGAVGVSAASISYCAHGKQTKCKGFRWEFVDAHDNDGNDENIIYHDHDHDIANETKQNNDNDDDGSDDDDDDNDNNNNDNDSINNHNGNFSPLPPQDKVKIINNTRNEKNSQAPSKTKSKTLPLKIKKKNFQKGTNASTKKNKRRTNKKLLPVHQLDRTTEKIIATFPSAKYAATAVGAHVANINGCLNGTRTTCKNFKWRYANVQQNIKSDNHNDNNHKATDNTATKDATNQSAKNNSDNKTTNECEQTYTKKNTSTNNSDNTTSIGNDDSNTFKSQYCATATSSDSAAAASSPTTSTAAAVMPNSQTCHTKTSTEGINSSNSKNNATSNNTPSTNAKPVVQRDVHTLEIIATFPSASEAARAVGASQSHISRCTNGRTKSCKGYVWSFAETTTIKKKKTKKKKGNQ